MEDGLYKVYLGENKLYEIFYIKNNELDKIYKLYNNFGRILYIWFCKWFKNSYNI